ncbi:MAG: peptidase U32 family protein [Methanobacteriota archaeon]
MAFVGLLSPAGGWDCLKAAVSEGADAVYFGVGKYNARLRAENFRVEDLGAVVGYCHDRGVKAHLALNTLVKNSELSDYFKLVERAYAENADAVILQEVSFAEDLKKAFPDMEFHASTQASIFNSYFQSLLAGFDRVILPREFTLKQVKEFTEKTRIPVEVFVQGALCFSISGQCLFSSFLFGRSGNRGSCAQPCRKRYGSRFLLSTRDLCVAREVASIIAAGVTSLKIEGRMRSSGYVGAATALYRHAIDDGVFDEDAFTDMEVAFSRSYTPGALLKEFDVVTPKASSKRGVLVGVVGSGGLVRLRTEVRIGDGVGVATKHGRHGDTVKSIVYKGRKVQKALAGRAVKLSLNAGEGDILTLTSAVQRRSKPKPRKRKPIRFDRTPKKYTPPKSRSNHLAGEVLLVKAYSLIDARKSADLGVSRVYYNLFAPDYPGGAIGAFIPRCLSQWSAEAALGIVETKNPVSVLCGDLGVASSLSGREVYLDVSCNAFNDVDVTYFNSRGMIPVISPELSLKEIADFKDKRFAIYAHGRIPLMTTRYALKENMLKDEAGYVFPVRSEHEHKQILNSIPLGLFDKILALRKNKVRKFLIDVTDGDTTIIRTYQQILKGEKTKKPAEYTMGAYKKGVK